MLTTTSPVAMPVTTTGGFFLLIGVPIQEADKCIVDFPNMKHFPGGASNDTSPDLQDPDNPLPLMDIKRLAKTIGSAD